MCEEHKKGMSEQRSQLFSLLLAHHTRPPWSLNQMLILFGSETGNAQDVAEGIGREASFHGLQPRVMSMDSYPVQELPNEHLVILIAATTGQGDPPKKMKAFWKFLLRRSLQSDSLSGVACAVFGLGDSGYVKYNVVGKKLANRLAGLGAEMIIDKGLGDDQHPSGYEAELDPWLEKLWKALELRLGLQKPNGPRGLGDPKFQVEYLGKRDGKALKKPDLNSDLRMAAVAAASFREVDGEVSGPGGENNGTEIGNSWKPYMARMTKNDRITSADHFQDTRHIEFDISESGIEYPPGNVLSIFPRTPSDDVEDFLGHFGLIGEEWVKISRRQSSIVGKESGGFMCSIREIGQGIIDISGASPRRFFFEVLHEFATDELEKERLSYFASPEGRDDLYVYNQREGRTVMQVLKDFSSAKPALEWLLQACPLKQPRQFSLSSSLKEHPGEAHITVAIVNWRTPFKRLKTGLCTSWLAGIRAGSNELIPIWVESGALTMPESVSAPMIMIGPGTGIAPFRSFLEERYAGTKDMQANSGSSILFFGCRSRESDYYYQQQLEEFQRKGVLDEQNGLIVAFSRDQQNKVYVTHKLREYGEIVRKWIVEKGAYIYVSGSAKKMPSNVMDALVGVLSVGDLSTDDARKFLRSLELTGRYVVEAWS